MSMIDSHRDGQILMITLNQPDKLNALTMAACHELAALWDDYEADDSLRVAIMTGTGRAFCAGHDLTDDINAPLPDTGWGGLHRRQTLDTPIIVAANGLTLGGGFALALACAVLSLFVVARHHGHVGAEAPVERGPGRDAAIEGVTGGAALHVE